MTRLGGLVFMLVGTAVAVTPAASALGRPTWLAGAVLAAALFYGVAAAAKSDLRQPLEIRGSIVALGVCAFGPSIAGIFVLLANLVGWAVGNLTEWVWAWFRQPPDVSTGLALGLSAAALFLIGLPMLAASTGTLLNWLARPPTERSGAATRLWRERHRTLASLVVGGILGLVSGATWASGVNPKVYLVLAQLALVFLCTPAWQVVEIARQRARSESKADSVQTLLEAAGFEIERLAPKTVEAAPLVRRIDLVARRGSEVVAVEVKSATDGRREIDWRAAPSLSLAASALAVDRELPHEAVRALLVLVGATPAPGLELSARDEHVGLLTLTPEELQAVSGDDQAREATVSKLWSALATQEVTVA